MWLWFDGATRRSPTETGQTLAEIIAEDATQYQPGSVEMSGEYKGLQAILEFYGRLANETNGSFRVELDRRRAPTAKVRWSPLTGQLVNEADETWTPGHHSPSPWSTARPGTSTAAKRTSPRGTTSGPQRISPPTRAPAAQQSTRVLDVNQLIDQCDRQRLFLRTMTRARGVGGGPPADHRPSPSAASQACST